MDTIKVIWNFVKSNVVLVLGIIIGILFFVLGIERKKIDSLEAGKELADTSAKDQVLTSQQNADKQQVANNNAVLDKTQQDMIQLAKDAEAKQQAEKDKTPEEVQNHWNNKPRC